jgi:hypothetical protein
MDITDPGMLSEIGMDLSGDGTPAGTEPRDESTLVKLCAAAFRAAWDRAVPHEEYELVQLLTVAGPCRIAHFRTSHHDPGAAGCPAGPVL